MSNPNGRFGVHGGQYVPETLMNAIIELEEAYNYYKANPDFQNELTQLLNDYAGRPSRLYYAEKMTKDLGGAKIYLKREDLNHTGAHKINNVLGQALLAKKMGKTRLIAETGAGQHGVATATAAALMGMECVVFMGKEDTIRQALNVYRMRLLGATVVPVNSGTATLKDAVSEAMREWTTRISDTHYCLGSVMGPHPFPTIVRDFQSVISSEIKQQILENIEEYVTSGLSKKVTNILETIKLLAFSDPFPIEQDCIHLQNGVYHLPDGSFQESRLFCQNRLPVRYDPKAASPDRWLTFLHELLDDADIPTLQEYLGYCLIPSTKGQKMMLIVGKGGEGKSRIGLVLKRLMGDAASNGSVQKVENNRFARADLERRLLMIDDDMDMNALPKTNYIKTIVTAEAKLDLERKGVQSYQRDIYARFLCFGNGALTSLYDHSDGFFRRQLILTTKDKPTDRTDDPFLVEKMCAELEGILLWCLEGLHRLVQNDFRFTVSERAAANVDTIKRSSNNVIDFMESEGYFRFKADYSISSKEFYDIYKQWCEDNACHSVSAIRFSAELRQNDRRYNLEATNNIYLPGGRRVRGFVGIEPLVHPCP